MGKTRVIILTDEQRQALDLGFRISGSHAFRQRCQTILLKSEKRSSVQVAGIVKMTQVSVNSWCDRYEASGIEGLRTKPGRGRKPILNKEADGAAVVAAVSANRQSLKAAKAAYQATEQGSDKQMSDRTLRRFLKVLTEDIRE